MSKSIEAPWWRTYPISAIQAGVWQIGALWMQAQVDEGELIIASGHDAEPDPPTWRYDTVLRDPDATPAIRLVGISEAIALRPALLDKTVVARPVSAVAIGPGAAGRFYMSTPVFIEWVSGDRVLYRAPSTQLRKTWIGESPRSGELAYATRTSASTVLSRMVEHPGRAITQVDVRNDGDSLLRLDRVYMPMEQLALYASTAHGLWTDGLRLRAVDGAIVEARIEALEGGVERLALPEVNPDRGSLRWVFGALFDGLGKGGWPR